MAPTVLRHRTALAAVGVFVLVASVDPLNSAAAPTTAATGSAAGITGTGSIVYARSHDLFLTTSDGSRTQRVTWDGSRATANHTGGVGYLSPSQSDSGGLIVAVRNQVGAKGSPTGWLWVMNRQGAVIRRFAPPQNTISSYPTIAACAPTPYAYEPDGIVKATVSPDGTRIAYVEQGTWQAAQGKDCATSPITSTFVVNINGTGAVRVRESATNNPWNLEAGAWASPTRLVIARTRTHQQLLYADAPHFTPQSWWANPDASDYDDAHQEPSFRRGIIASVGISSFSNARVLRLWTSAGPPAAVTPRCEYAATGGGSNPEAGSPSVSPDGTGVAWYEQGTNATEVAGEGIYVMRTGTPATSCPADGSKRLLVQGGYMPFWGPAAVTTPPAPTLRVNSVSGREGNSGTHNRLFTVTRSGNAATTVTVRARTASRTATSGVDFLAVAVSVRFLPGQRSRIVAVPVRGDRRRERNEIYRLNLSRAVGARIAVARGTGTIVNDDA